MTDTQMPVAVVTESAHRLGRHLCEVLAARGYRVVIISRTSANDAQALAAAIQSRGGSARVIRADIGVQTEVHRVFDDLRAREGRVDLLLNTGGDPDPKDVTQLDPATWDATVAARLSGAYYCCYYALRLMPDGGQIISIGRGGLEGIRAIRLGADDYVSAAGLLALTRALAAGYAQRQIRVNMVSPSQRDNVDDPPTPSEVGVEGPLHGAGIMSDISQAVTYLLDASYVSGVNIEVTGEHGL